MKYLFESLFCNDSLNLTTAGRKTLHMKALGFFATIQKPVLLHGINSPASTGASLQE